MTGRKREEDGNTKIEYREWKGLLDETEKFFIVFEGLSFGGK